MNVFISWSGQLSNEVALALRSNLKLAFPHIQFWMSSEDMRPGTPWPWEIGIRLSEARVGIVCLTPQNLASPWILFESGALSHTFGRNWVIPYLFDLSPADLSGPLAQLQAISATEEGTRKLFKLLNEVAEEPRLTDTESERVFSVWWPEIRKAMNQIKRVSPAEFKPRSDRDLLEEVLELARDFRHRNFVGTPTVLYDRAWKPEEFVGKPPSEVFEFFQRELLPQSYDHARREWEYVETHNPEKTTRERALELAQGRAIALGLGSLWERWMEERFRDRRETSTPGM